ncbi:heme peroxidase [Halenospora varia]|nr:heme peroxidase [Halenospora varia]
MFLHSILPLLFLPFLPTTLTQGTLVSSATDSNGISLYEKLEVMERLVLDGAVGVSVNPCSFFRTGNPNSGEQTSAEWVRIVFHDAITADLAAGTGGLDASIGFESLRAENVGLHFVNDTIGIFASFVSAYTSMADLIALGLHATLMSCDPVPRLIKLKVGRIDATGPGPEGVPKPTDDLNTTLTAFEKAGFSQTEAIQSVACGHSLGAVHQMNFPDIIPASVVTSTNLDGGSNFDSTPAIFDATNINEYLNGTGNAGGPLVVGFNSTTNSDLRLFSSDNNATMLALTEAQKFQDTCYTIFEKMLDTVPSNVVLSEVIGPRTWTMGEMHADLRSDGGVVFSGSITWHSLTETPITKANYTYSTSNGGDVGVLSSAIGVSSIRHGFGTITKYSFSNMLNTTDITGISVMNGLYTTPVDLSMFILLSQTKRGGSISAGPAYVVRAAILTILLSNATTPTANLFNPTKQANTLSPTIKLLSTPMTAYNTSSDYTLFKGILSLGTAGSGPGALYFDVRLGEKISVKVAGTLVGSCSSMDINAC